LLHRDQPIPKLRDPAGIPAFANLAKQYRRRNLTGACLLNPLADTSCTHPAYTAGAPAADSAWLLRPSDIALPYCVNIPPAATFQTQ
jgi:hypothetical protein